MSYAYASTHVVEAPAAQTLDTVEVWEQVAGTYVNGAHANTGSASDSYAPSEGVITLRYPGVYRVRWDISLAAPSGEYELGVDVSGSINANTKATFGSARNDADKPTPLSREAILSLVAGDTLALHVRCMSASGNAIQIDDAALLIERMD